MPGGSTKRLVEGQSALSEANRRRAGHRKWGERNPVIVEENIVERWLDVFFFRSFFVFNESFLNDLFLGDGFKYFSFPPLPGEDSHFD